MSLDIISNKGKDIEKLKEEIIERHKGWEFYFWEKEVSEGEYELFAVPMHQLLDLVQQTVWKICQKISPYSSVRVRPDKKNGTSILAIISSRKASSFIGWHGQTLDAIELIVSAIVAKKLSTYVPIIVDTAQYRKKREEFLRALVGRTVREIEKDHKERPIPHLLPKERRIIHTMFANHPYITTQSRGKGDERTLYLLPRPELTKQD